MDTANEPTTLMGSLLPKFSVALTSLRERSRDLLRDQEERLKDLEARLEQQFVAALDRLDQEAPDVSPAEQELADEVESLQRDVRHLQQLRRESEQALDEARIMLGEMEEERRILRSRLDDAEQGLPGEDSAGADPDEVERLHRRLEMAMQEIRDLKAHSEDRVAPSDAASGPASVRADDSSQFDWETQKRRLLQQLETSFDTKVPSEASEKLRCEEIIRATDRAIAEKDQEIAELRRQLAERPTEPISDHLAMTQEILDADELVKQERQRLAQLQEEWQEKLRRAEVEVSIERAKMARERLQLEEKLRSLEGGESATNPASDPKQGGRGRWLTRLGLGGDNAEENS